MQDKIKVTIGVTIAAVLLVLAESVFILNQTEQAIVLQFGEPVREIKEPGLKFKIPFKSYWHNQTFTDQILRISHQGTLFVKLPFK